VDMALKKVDYVRKMGLGGAMWWEISGDKNGTGSIVTNVSAPDEGVMGEDGVLTSD
jgi:chitinase